MVIKKTVFFKYDEVDPSNGVLTMFDAKGNCLSSVAVKVTVNAMGNAMKALLKGGAA